MIQRAFFIKPQWAELILSGKKTWELRPGHTTIINEPVGIIETGTGTIIATCSIVDSIGPLSDAELADTARFHRTTPADRRRPKDKAPWRHVWKLTDVQALPEPVAYEHRWGQQSWASVGPAVAERIRRQLAALR